MKLDSSSVRHLSNDDWRVLAAVEQGSKNHEVVPTPLIQQIANLRGGGGAHKCISNLAKVGLIAKVKNARYDGYRLTYGGLDYLALNTHRRNSTIFSLGNQIGVGKESDIYITASPSNKLQVLKIHRLGRISFRSVKSKRDYLRNRTTGSWMYLSRLSAHKEFEVMKVLWREGFVVPEPIGWNRHTIVMGFVDSFPLRMVEGVPEPAKLYANLMEMIVQLAQRGLIHGDFNEFNILVKEQHTSSGKPSVQPVLIDFPQAVSTNHVNADMYFERDVGCIKRYFERRFKYVSDEPGPFLKDALKGMDPQKRLDVEVEASGFSKKMARELEKYVEATEQMVEGEDAGQQDGNDASDGEDESGSEEEEMAEEGDDAVVVGAAEFADQAVKPATAAGYGLMPLDLPSGQDVGGGEKLHKRKAATGWAI